ncbi:MAG: leucine-rich repeat domain-containing protein, partial [Spirochaetaceae bacterium]|nr:leucine-rich repeat domain-containing protein [Spirochaetaceae bacterium]
SLPKAASIGPGAFQICTKLTTVSLPVADFIGVSAFLGCTSLETVSLPKAASIDGNAFQNCTALTTVSLPEATSIGESAFYGCTSLETVSLPKAAFIGGNAFQNCTALTTVSLPEATSIGKLVFAGTSAKTLTVTLGATAPTLGMDMFASASEAKIVTVKVPSGEAAWSGKTGTFNETGPYTDNWGNGFRGKGWDGSNYGSGTVNSYISLTITYTP